MKKNGKESGKVGKGHPPKEYQFTSENQPENKGRPKGARDFKTIFEEAAKEVAKSLKLGEKPDVVQIEILKKGIKEGIKGNFNYYRDIVDRLYGKTTEKIEHSGEIETKVDLSELNSFIKWRKSKK